MDYKYTDFEFFKRKSWRNSLLVNCPICFSQHLQPEFPLQLMQPYAYTRFHTQSDIRASTLDNQFVYILDGNEAG